MQPLLQSIGLWLEHYFFPLAHLRGLWPTLEAIHFVGLTLLLGSVLLLDLRMLGVAKQLPCGPVHRLTLTWAFVGFGLMAVTGFTLMAGKATAFLVDNPAFYLKMLALFLAGLNALAFYLTVHLEVEAVGPGEDAPPLAKAIAGISLFLWFSVITFGRYMALS